MSSLKDRIKDHNDTKWEAVPIPEWGEGVVLYVRNTTHEEKIQWELSLASKTRDGKVKTSLQQAQYKMVSLVTFEQEGGTTPFFTPGDWQWVKGKGSGPIQKLFDTAIRLSGVSNTDVDELFENLT